VAQRALAYLEPRIARRAEAALGLELLFREPNRRFASWTASPALHVAIVHPAWAPNRLASLLRVLAQLELHFGGRRLGLMSGYRAPDDAQALSSFHQVGHAADIWIDGVINRDLFEYCHTL